MEESYCPSSLVSVERPLRRDRSTISLLGFAERILRDLSILSLNTEKEMNESKSSARLNPSKPIEELFDCPKECSVIAIVDLLPCTMEQMIGNALIAI